MIPQGSNIVNGEFFSALQRRADSIQSCAELQAFTTETMDSLNASLSAIRSQLGTLAPVLKLLSLPGADPKEIVSWIGDFAAAFIAPYAKPYATYSVQLAEMAAAIAELTITLQAKADSIDACSIEFPTTSTSPAGQ